MRTKRHDEVVELIEQYIKQSDLKAGERIPAERYLAEKFHVSRNTIREAIKALAEKAVVVSRRGAGTFVAEGAFTQMVDAATRKNGRLKEIFEVRMLLEPHLAGLAAQRISPENLDALASVLRNQQACMEEGGNIAEYDELFHRIIAESAGNTILAEIYETMTSVLAESRVQELQSTTRNQISLKSHQDIFQALTVRDKDRASALMKNHMVRVEQNLELPK